jgi:hypothetical protein
MIACTAGFVDVVEVIRKKKMDLNKAKGSLG